jgi:hypothetical protein
MFTTLILIIIFLAAASLLWWGVGRLAIPEPVKTVLLVIIGLVMLAMIYQYVAGGHLATVFR